MAVTVTNTSASLTGKTLLKAEDAQNITGLKTFNLGVSAPFAVAAGAAKVNNLDSDKLDGQEGAFYQDASNLNAGTVPIARMVAADPNADRGVFWDDSAGVLAFLELVGLAIRGTQLVLAPGIPNGRLTLTSATPVTPTDVTAATTLYYAHYCGNKAAAYNSAAWENFVFSELSIAIPATTNQMYDVFFDYNSGTPQLVLLAWTNDTTRATALTTQDGVLVKTGATGQRFIGCVRTTGVSGQTEDSVTKRYVQNYYNRHKRELAKSDSTATWAYSTATVRQARADATNQVDIIQGLQQPIMDLMLIAAGRNDTGVSIAAGIGEDSTTTFTTRGGGHKNGTSIGQMVARICKAPAIGRHVYSWNEWSAAVGNSDWFGSQGDSTPAGVANGLRGWIEG